MITNSLSADMQRRRQAALKWRGLEGETLQETLSLLQQALNAEQWSELSQEMVATAARVLADKGNPLGAGFNDLAQRTYQRRAQRRI